MCEGSRPSVYPGLTEEELVVLQVLIELRETHPEVLARRTGIPEGPRLTAALERFVSLSYAIRLERSPARVTGQSRNHCDRMGEERTSAH